MSDYNPGVCDVGEPILRTAMRTGCAWCASLCNGPAMPSAQSITHPWKPRRRRSRCAWCAGWRSGMRQGMRSPCRTCTTARSGLARARYRRRTVPSSPYPLSSRLRRAGGRCGSHTRHRGDPSSSHPGRAFTAIVRNAQSCIYSAGPAGTRVLAHMHDVLLARWWWGAAPPFGGRGPGGRVGGAPPPGNFALVTTPLWDPRVPSGPSP